MIVSKWNKGERKASEDTGKKMSVASMHRGSVSELGELKKK